MLIAQTRLLNMPILSLQTGAPLGQTTQAIIDPRQLHIVAFYCSGQRVQGTAVLHTTDIREVSNIGLIVDGAERIMPLDDDLVRLREVLSFRFELIGKTVIDTRKRRLGKVEGYSIDTESFYISKLNVRQSIFKSFTGGNLLIDRNQIVEVNDKHIIVQANEAKEKGAARATAKILENPFRHQPQPNGNAQAKAEQD